MKNHANGVVEHLGLNRKTDYLFRLSVKGLIRNSEGEVLVVKEDERSWWDLPGGGMDHEENIKDALARELHEEVSFVGDFDYQIIAIEDPHLLEHSNVWQIRVVFEITPNSFEFSAGEDGDETLFINPDDLMNSDFVAERKVYEYSRLASR